MNKNTLIITGIALTIIIGGVVFFLNNESDKKESLIIEQNLTPIELSQEELQALKDAGFTMPSGEDASAKDLQRVRSSDELDAIEADLNETDLSGLDAELEAIEDNLFEL